MKIIALALIAATIPHNALACLACDQKIVLNIQQVACLQTELPRYLHEAKLMDPVSINMASCDGTAEIVSTDEYRNNTVPVSDRTQTEAADQLVDWYFLSEAQLTCLQEPLKDPVFGADGNFIFAFDSCPN